MSINPKPIIFTAVAIVAALAGALLAYKYSSLQAAPIALQSGTLLQPPRPLPHFALIDQNGQPFDAAALRNQWSLLFFGFTNCGDVCPTTLALLASTTKSLMDLPDAQRPHIVFISVDAKRDTPEVLKSYLKAFDPTFTGVTGRQPDLDAFTTALSVPSAIRPLENGGYAVDHSAAILVVNPQAELQALFSPPHTIDALATDYRRLIGAAQ